MKIELKRRNYEFSNNWQLEVAALTQYMTKATLYDDFHNVVYSGQAPKITERLGIVHYIERKCKQQLLKQQLLITKENMIYYASDIVIEIEDEIVNMHVVVTPYKQKARARVEVSLIAEDTLQELLHRVQECHYDAYKKVENGIEETIKEYIRQIRYHKVYDYHNIPKIEKRTLYFNDGEYKVDIENKEYFTAVNYIIVYRGEEEQFRVPVPQFNFYERSEVLRTITNLLAENNINIIKMDSEESEWTHGTWGTFTVRPLGNNNIEISKQGIINIKRKYNIDYNNFNGIVQCVNDIIEKLNTNVMKYVDKEQAGDVNWKQKEREEANKRRKEARRADRQPLTKTDIEQPTIKGLFGLFRR